jgi:hypothetical protein
MKSLKQVAKRVAHAAALIFGAWWLVATSMVPVPQPGYDCFTGIADQTRLQVTLDAAPPAPNPNPYFPLCGALDGLLPGSTLVFSISKVETESGECFHYDTFALEPTPPGVTWDRSSPGSAWDLTAVEGTFTLPAQSACHGSWALWLSPETEPVRDHPISPLDAGPNQRWFVRRTMTIAQAQFCDGMIDGSGEVSCSDKFVVASIADLGAP